MRQSLCKRKMNLVLLAALTVGAFSVSTVAAQRSAPAPKQPADKKSSSSSSTTSKHTGTRKSGKRRSKKVKGQAAPTPERISEIQDALAKKGVFAGSSTGKWDDATVDAVKRFQTTNGLTPTGKLDALTLQKLGLGSETAGLAAPTAPPNTTNRLKNLSSLPQDPPQGSTNQPER